MTGAGSPRRGARPLVVPLALLCVLGAGAGAAVAAQTPTCRDRYGQAREATIVGTPDDDVLTGTPETDVIVALAGADTVDGGGGYDVVCGGLGDDTLTGVGVARGGRGEDSVDGFYRAYGGPDGDELRGAVDNNVLLGGRGPDVLDGGEGNDNLVGGPGDDVVDGGPGSDFMSADPGADTIDGGDSPTDPSTSGWYVVRCGDWIYWHSAAGAFDAEDIELGVTDTPPFGAGVEVDLRSGTAESGGTGVDRLTGVESATGTAADDVLRGSSGVSCLWSYGGDDRLVGRAGDDGLSAGPGHDRVRAGAGDDVLSLGGGASRLRGGSGTDWVQWPGRVDVDLRRGAATGHRVSSRLEGIENVNLSLTDGGTVRGDGGANVLYSRHVFGRAGDDTLWGFSSDGGRGTDNCLGEAVRCEGSDEDALSYPAYTP